MNCLGDLAESVAGFAMLALFTVFLLFQLGLLSPVVREHCLSVDKSEDAGDVQVDSGRPFIVSFPFFAGIDPPGRCVRNTQSRELLSAIGVWRLPSPEEQVRKHVEEQLREQQDRQ